MLGEVLVNNMRGMNISVGEKYANEAYHVVVHEFH
jgi:hypothetical protein